MARRVRGSYTSRLMKITLTSLFAVALLSTGSFLHAQDAAPDPARKAAADKLLRAMQVDKMMQSSFDQMAKMQQAMIAQQVSDPAEQAKTQKAVAAAMESTQAELSWDKIGGMFVEIYAEVFTAEEMQKLTEFYQSPIGQKFTEKQPELQAATMQKMQGFMMTLMPKMQAKIEAAMKDVGADKPAATPAE